MQPPSLHRLSLVVVILWIASAVRFAGNEPLPAHVDITLEFETERVMGASGCNRYMAAIEAPASPTDPVAALRLGPAAGTRRRCGPPLDDVESRYLTRLSHVTQFAFVMGQLALSWHDEGRSGTLLFDPR